MAFVILAALTLLSALGVVISRSVIHSALFMATSFFGVAGFFVMLNAPVLAAFQVLIYVGAVTVVLLFAVMFTQRPQVRGFATILNRQVWPGLIGAAGIAAFVSVLLVVEDWSGLSSGQGLRDPHAFGRVLLGVEGDLGIFGLLFQVIAFLLLVATVAALVISQRKSGEEG